MVYNINSNSVQSNGFMCSDRRRYHTCALLLSLRVINIRIDTFPVKCIYGKRKPPDNKRLHVEVILFTTDDIT